MDNRFREWTLQSHMTQREIAAKLGVSQSYIAALVSPDPPWPSREVFLKMVALTELSADELIGIGPTSRIAVRRVARRSEPV